MLICILLTNSAEHIDNVDNVAHHFCKAGPPRTDINCPATHVAFWEKLVAKMGLTVEKLYRQKRSLIW